MVPRRYDGTTTFDPPPPFYFSCKFEEKFHFLKKIWGFFYFLRLKVFENNRDQENRKEKGHPPNEFSYFDFRLAIGLQCFRSSKICTLADFGKKFFHDEKNWNLKKTFHFLCFKNFFIWKNVAFYEWRAIIPSFRNFFFNSKLSYLLQTVVKP